MNTERDIAREEREKVARKLLAEDKERRRIMKCVEERTSKQREEVKNKLNCVTVKRRRFFGIFF